MARMSTETTVKDVWEPVFLVLPRRVVTRRMGDRVLERKWQWLRHCARRRCSVEDGFGDVVREWCEYDYVTPVVLNRLRSGATGREFNEMLRKR